MQVQVNSFVMFLSLQDADKLVQQLKLRNIFFKYFCLGTNYDQGVLELKNQDKEQIFAIAKHFNLNYRVIQGDAQPPTDREFEFLPPQPKHSQTTKPNAQIARFTPKDDQKLIELHNRFGSNWKAIAESLPPFTPTMCRDRYNYKLNPIYKQGPFTLDEDQQLLYWVSIHGRNFARISPIMKRSRVQLKVRYNSLEKAQDRLKAQITPPNLQVPAPVPLPAPVPMPMIDTPKVMIKLVKPIQIDEKTFFVPN